MKAVSVVEAEVALAVDDEAVDGVVVVVESSVSPVVGSIIGVDEIADEGKGEDSEAPMRSV